MSEINAKVGDKYWYVRDVPLSSHEIYCGPVVIEKVNSKTVTFTDPGGKKKLARPCTFNDGTFEVDGTGSTYRRGNSLVPANERNNAKAKKSQEIEKANNFKDRIRVAGLEYILDRLGIGLIEEMIRKLDTPSTSEPETD